MGEHYIVPLLSSTWYWGLAAATVIITVGLFIFKFTPEQHRKKLATGFGILILAVVGFTQIYLWTMTDFASVTTSLPLQLCDLSFILCGIVLLTRGQLAYEWALLVGFPGAIHSILTPELTHGTSPYLFFEYFFSHSAQMLVPLALTYFYGMRPRRESWWKVFGVVNIVLAAVFAFDLATGANYIYLLKKPAVDNPLLIGPWPWYIIGVEIAGLLHIILFYFIFRKRGAKKAGAEAVAENV